MQRISFAPVLSATRSRDSCWITSLLLCLRSALWWPARAGGRPSHGRTAVGVLPRPSGPWKLMAQNGPAVHGTRCLPGPDTWGAPPHAAGAGVLLGLLDHRDQPPPLGGGGRPGLHDLHPVADARDVLLVVGLQLAGAPDDLAVQAVLHAVLDLDDDGLLHLVADHEALTDLAVAPAGQARAARGRFVGGRRLSLAHATPSFGATERPSSRSRMIV